jgi:hypothetical protein
MSQTSVRKMGEVDNLSQLPRAQRIDVLRAKMDALSVSTGSDAHRVTKQVIDDTVAAPQALAELLPGGGFARGESYSCTPCSQLCVEIIAHISAFGGMAAVVGWPELSFAGVKDAGGDLSRIIAVPDAGLEPLNTVAVLLEGLDAVVYKGAPITLSPVRARPLRAKLRAGRGFLLTADTVVPQSVAHIDATVDAFHGIGQGTGRIRGVELGLAVKAKAQMKRGRMIVGRPATTARGHLRVV